MCPPGIDGVLPQGQSSMSVIDKWREPITNIGTIKCSHDSNYEFPAGITTVTFTATTADGEQDSCSIQVRIAGMCMQTLRILLLLEKPKSTF